MRASVAPRAAVSSVFLLSSAACATSRGSGPTDRGTPVRTIRYTEPLTIDAFWRDIYQPGEPVLIKGLLEGTPIMDHFSSDALRSGQFSHFRHNVIFHPGHGQGPRNPHNRRQSGWLFRDVEAWLANQRGAKEGGPIINACIQQQPCSHEAVLHTWLGSLPNSLWLPAHQVQPALWVNFNATPMATGLHFDPMDNFFMAIEGKKAFQVYPFGQGDNIEPDPNYKSYSRSLYPIYALSGFDAEGMRQEVLNPDISLFPGFAKAKGALVELEPGDVFYLPSGYWHGGVHDDFTVGVSFWWTVLWPHEKVFEYWMRRTPRDNDDAPWAKWPLAAGFEDVPWPDEPSEFSQEQKFFAGDGRSYDSIDFDVLERLRSQAGCFHSSVASWKEFEAKLAAIGEEVSCMREWYGQHWDKLQQLADRPLPGNSKALEHSIRLLDRGGESLRKRCGMKRHRTWSYGEMLENAFPGCEAPDGCDEILRKARAAVRSIVRWERCLVQEEL